MGPQTGHLSCVWCVLLILFDSSSLLLLRRRLRGGSDVFQTHACDIFLRFARGAALRADVIAASSHLLFEARGKVNTLRHAPALAAGVGESSRTRQSAQQRSPAGYAERQRMSPRI